MAQRVPPGFDNTFFEVSDKEAEEFRQLYRKECVQLSALLNCSSRGFQERVKSLSNNCVAFA